jgi:polyhydroxybutyrate depolymerase
VDVVSSQVEDMCHNLPHDKLARYKDDYNTSLHEHFLEADGQRRRYLLYDAGLQHRAVWLLTPGQGSPAEQILAISGLHDFARQHRFTLVVLEGSHCTFNVHLKSQSFDHEPDDVIYTKKVLQEIVQRVSPDMTRVGCIGYSNGARFCSRLASELSNIITGIASVGGIRYPSPNNATLPVPVLAFHGVKDPINPFWGRGDPSYWHTSVPDAVQAWANFNRCKAKVYKKIDTEVSTEQYFECDRDADVVLMRVEPGGHTWPGSDYDFTDLGLQFGVSAKLQANKVALDFFEEHPRTTCHTATRGEPCFDDVTWAKEHDWRLHPARYSSLTRESSFEEFQQVLHATVRANCPMPCPNTGITRSAIGGDRGQSLWQSQVTLIGGLILIGCVISLVAALMMCGWAYSSSGGRWLPLRKGAFPRMRATTLEPGEGKEVLQ